MICSTPLLSDYVSDICHIFFCLQIYYGKGSYENSSIENHENLLTYTCLSL